MVRCFNGYSFRCIVFFYQFVKGLVERYPEIFDNEGGHPSEHQARFARKWGSYTTIHELAGGDILRFNEIVELPLEQCLLSLAYRADKALLEDMLHKQIMAQP